MILLEPNLPAMPVNVTGPSTASAPNLSQRASGTASPYARARVALKAAFGLECGFALGVVAHGAAVRPAATAWLLALGCIGVLLVSFAAVEMAGAIFDIAEGQTRAGGQASEGGEPRW